MTRGYWVTFFILVALGASILLKKSMEFRCLMQVLLMFIQMIN